MMPKVELKRNMTYFDEISGSSLTGGSSTPVAQISQGTGVYQRNGNKITVKGLHIKGLFHNNATKTQLVRIMVLSSKINTTTNFQDMALWDNANQAGGVSTPNGSGGANAMYQTLNKRSYTAYWDKIYKLGPVTDPSGVVVFNKFIKMNKVINFISNNTGDTQQDQISVVISIAQADDDTGLGEIVEQSFNAALYYSDA